MRGHSDATYVAAIETGLVAKYWYPISYYFNMRDATISNAACVIIIDFFF